MTQPKIKPTYKPTKLRRGWAKIELPPTLEEAERFAKAHAKRGRGRPHTNPSLEEYTLKSILSHLETSMDEHFGDLRDYDLLQPGNTVLEENHFFDEDRLFYSVIVPGKGPNYRVGFSDGLKVAIEVFRRAVIPNLLIEAIARDGLTLNASKEAARREAQKTRKMKSEAIAQFVQEMLENLKKRLPLPSDIVRKVRRPAIARKEILRFTRAIKDMEGPAYIDKLATELNLAVEEVKALHQEALRQKFQVKISKDNEGREFFLM
jgi:hypothetical protein